ncbi:MAG: hypothetical protein D6747_01160 [Chlorobiota bacterium]|nr:MAG: hypothetical protein D6747_01160 [Chlorobiota bacterium]
MRWFIPFCLLSVSVLAQSYIESPISVCGFLGAARGANEVPAPLQNWGIAGGLSALVQDRTSDILGGEMNFWYARTLSTAPDFRYATGAIMVDVRGRATIRVPLQVPSVAFVAAGVGALFPLNEMIMQQPPSPNFEPNTPALAVPLSVGIRTRVLEQFSVELRATFVLTTTDNLNAPHDGKFDGITALLLGIVVPVGY